jgi:hypothetical protein
MQSSLGACVAAIVGAVRISADCKTGEFRPIPCGETFAGLRSRRTVAYESRATRRQGADGFKLAQGLRPSWLPFLP